MINSAIKAGSVHCMLFYFVYIWYAWRYSKADYYHLTYIKQLFLSIPASVDVRICPTLVCHVNSTGVKKTHMHFRLN